MTQRWRGVQVSVAAVIAALAVLTACAADPESPGAGGAGMTDGSGMTGTVAPMPANAPEEAPDLKRDVVKTATVRMTVTDPSVAADDAAVIVEDAGGRVDARTEDSGSGTGRAVTSVILRVPAAELDGVVRELKGLGTVELAETTAEDVTAQRVDLDARIRALQTSVDRLLAIMADARDPEALITAEGALSQRQAELDSLRAQRDALGDRVDFSTVNVSFVAGQIGGPAPQQYRGFFGQVERGWDGLVSVAGSAVLLFGLLLPWLVVLAVIAAACYGLYRVAGRKADRPAVAVVGAEVEVDDPESRPEHDEAPGSMK